MYITGPLAGATSFNMMQKNTLLYKILRPIKKSLNWLILPDSAAIIKGEQEKIRRHVCAGLDNVELALDIGCGNRPVCRFKKVISMDFDNYPNLDVLGDALRIPFADGAFDLVWLGGVLEHIQDPRQAIKEIHRVLKKGGYLYAEVPFFQRVHAAPADFQRFTIVGLTELCSPFSKLESGVIAGPSCAFSHILRQYLALCLSFNNRHAHHFFYYYVLGWVTFPIKFLDLILSRYKGADTMAFAFYYLGKKI